MRSSTFMHHEALEAPAAFARAARADHTEALAGLELDQVKAFYTIARGSSDAAALVLAYEMMRQLRRPVTSLPPSIMALDKPLDMAGTAALVVSQSGGSPDLVRNARQIRAGGGQVLGLCNTAQSPLALEVNHCIDIGAGAERAIPATKSVVASIGAGLSMLATLVPGLQDRLLSDAAMVDASGQGALPRAEPIKDALRRADRVFVIGRDCGFGAAQEIALKLKETCAIHAEAHSAAEVLHGPLQLATKPLVALVLHAAPPAMAPSLRAAEDRLRGLGAEVHVIPGASPEPYLAASHAALTLCQTYPLINALALEMGFDPDTPNALRKVTATV